MSQYVSMVFGTTRDCTAEEREIVKQLVATLPVMVFQELNKALNAKGFLLCLECKADLGLPDETANR